MLNEQLVEIAGTTPYLYVIPVGDKEKYLKNYRVGAEIDADTENLTMLKDLQPGTVLEEREIVTNHLDQDVGENVVRSWKKKDDQTWETV